MSEYRLTPRTACGADQAQSAAFGGCTLTERPDLALASVAARQGFENTVRAALETLIGGALDVGAFVEDAPISAFWSGPAQWFVMADHGAHETLAQTLKDQMGTAASITEQNDGWVAFDLEGAGSDAVLERLCNIELAGFATGSAQRTVIEHINCFVLCREQGRAYRIYCGRSFALSLWHGLETTAASAAAVAQLESL